MARQGGILKIKGTIGGMTFYKSSQDGHLVREKGGVSGDRIASDPAFARTRENGQEFGNAGSSGKSLRDAVRNLMMNASDGRVTSRVLKVFMDILKLDTDSARGSRTVALGLLTPEGMNMLKGFNFNVNAVMGSILFKNYTLDAGSGEVSMLGLIPLNDIVAPTGATHFSLRSAFAMVNFDTGISAISISPESIMPIDNTAVDVTLTPDGGAPAGDGNAIYLLMVEFFQEVNSQKYSLKSGAYNALSIIEVA